MKDSQRTIKMETERKRERDITRKAEKDRKKERKKWLNVERIVLGWGGEGGGV
jgi:hypothetical protein